MTRDYPPPWRSFPRTRLRPGQTLARITFRRNPEGTPRSPWYFSSTGSTSSGRFDLPTPRGTCYWSDAAIGAFVEVFRRLRVIARPDLEARHLVVATRTGPPLPLASLVSARAAAYGVTLDTAGGDDYRPTQELAAHLADVGLLGVIAPTRHDPTLRARTVALFGRSGPVRARRGWTTRRNDLTTDPDLLLAVHEYGYAVLDIPCDLPITEVDV
jgi:hypothetical protein